MMRSPYNQFTFSRQIRSVYKPCTSRTVCNGQAPAPHSQKWLRDITLNENTSFLMS